MKKEALVRGQTVNVHVESLAPSGEGVSKDYGMPIFIDRTAPGDHALVSLFDVRSNFARASLVELSEASSERSEPPCKLFKVCGGCQWQHLSYEYQLVAKKQIIQQALVHVGKLPPDLVKNLVQNPIACQDTLFYRNKVQFPVRHPQGSKRILAGYFKQDSHELVNIKHCPIQPDLLDLILDQTKLACEQYGISAYDESKHHGLLRFINIRYSKAAHRALLTLVLNCLEEKLPKRLKDMAADLMLAVPELAGVCANFNRERGNRILGRETICLAGEGFIEERLASARPEYPSLLRQGLRFRLSPTSFFQINSAQASILLEIISECLIESVQELSQNLNSAPGDNLPVRLQDLVVVDAYSGVGTITLWLAAFVKQVLAIEENAQAVEDARFNALTNGITNTEFEVALVEEKLADFAENRLAPDVVVVDPPRKGCARAAIEAIVKLCPKIIIYVSCNPVTLARDLQLFALPIERDDGTVVSGYKTKKILPIDLFPQTYHVESVSVLIPS
jgi:23S rRNA (uracil1939-C5)-methyltransferase